EKSKSKTSNAQVGVEIAKSIFKAEANSTNNIETITGEQTIFTIKILGYNVLIMQLNGYGDVYSLFELLDHELKQKVLSAIGHQI
ncbi:38608_t:CDS:1, partial [Gigaspora margarita]